MSNKVKKEIRGRLPYDLPDFKGYDVLNWVDHTDNFEKFLEKKMTKLKRKGGSVQDCFEYFESIVQEYIGKIRSQLDNIHIENKKNVKKYLKRQESDKYEFKEMSKMLTTQIEETEEELKLIKDLYKNHNPLNK